MQVLFFSHPLLAPDSNLDNFMNPGKLHAPSLKIGGNTRPIHHLAGEAKIAHVKREYTQEELQAATYQSMAYNRTGTWRDYLPVRQLSEEEWDLYQARKAQRFQEK